MSALVRVSHGVARRRLVHSRRLAPAQETRRHSWTPAAYRHKKSFSSPSRKKEKTGQPSRQDRLWKNLQQVYDRKKKEPRKRRQRTSFTRNDRLEKLQQEGITLIESYQKTLYPDVHEGKLQNKNDLMALLNDLHEQSSNDDKVPTWESILNTEDQFRDIGTLMPQLIVEFARSKEKDSSLAAEELLRAMIRLRQDRSMLVGMAEKARLEEQQRKANTFTGWFKQIFIMAPGMSPSDETTETMAHQEKFGPRKREFLAVLRSIHREAKEFTWDIQDYHVHPKKTRTARNEIMTCADRMAALVDLLPEHGISCSQTFTRPVIETYASVGSLESAMQAERIYVDVCQQRVPASTFGLLLQAYRLAALIEATTSSRAEAATRAQAALYNRITATAEAYTLVLQTFRNAGKDALPDMMGRSERLIIRLYGKDNFYKIVENTRKEVPPKGESPQVFEILACMYAESHGSDERKSLNRAKNILAWLEERRKLEQKSTSNGKDEATPLTPFPSVEVYNAILYGIGGEAKRTKRETRNSIDSHPVQQMLKEEAMYASSLLDRMVVDRGSLPDHVTFVRILRIWANTKLPESGERADEILSRWNIRRACTGLQDDLITINGAVEALRCWAVSANAGYPGALQRALRIFEKEEARTGASRNPRSAASTYSDAENKIINSVYEGRDSALRKHYDAAIRVCSVCRDEPESALEAAFEIYNRMIAAGIKPVEETFTYLVLCCANLLPKESSRRSEVAETVYAFARDSGVSTDRLVAKMQKEKLRRSQE